MEVRITTKIFISKKNNGMKKNLLKSFVMAVMAMLSVNATAQIETTYSPTLDVNFRTASGNTAWNSGFPKSAADEGNKDFELTYTAGLFALQKYTVAELKSATKLVLTLTVGSKSGVDAIRLWSFPNNSWTAETGIDDILPVVSSVIGIDPRATEGTPNEPLVKGAKVADSSPAKMTLTIQGAALSTIKANADADGTFTLLLTNDKLMDTSNKRSYLSNNSENDEANRPTLVVTAEAPTVLNTTTGVSYKDLNEAFADAVAADADCVLEVSADQKLTGRLTWNVEHSISIIPTKDITVKGPKNAMWFLVNKSNATMSIGSKEHKMTLDGINDDRSPFNNSHVTRRENTTKLYLTNIEFRDFNLGANTLIGCKNNGGGIYLEDIAIVNCSCTGNALIENLREENDKLCMKGFLNVSECTGTTIYTAKNRIKVGDEESTSIYDDFSASNVITITLGTNFPMTEGTPVVVKVPGTAKDMFKLTNEGWYLDRKPSSGDLFLTQSDPTAITGLNTINGYPVEETIYTISGKRVTKMTRGLYIVNGKKVIVN